MTQHETFHSSLKYKPTIKCKNAQFFLSRGKNAGGIEGDAEKDVDIGDDGMSGSASLSVVSGSVSEPDDASLSPALVGFVLGKFVVRSAVDVAAKNSSPVIDSSNRAHTKYEMFHTWLRRHPTPSVL